MAKKGEKTMLHDPRGRTSLEFVLFALCGVCTVVAVSFIGDILKLIMVNKCKFGT